MGQGFFVHTRQSDSLSGCGVSYLNRDFSLSSIRLLSSLFEEAFQSHCFWVSNSITFDGKLNAFGC